MKKTALVTGASSGIGLEMARVFAREGHSVVLVARNADQLEQITQELTEKYRVRALCIAEDLTKQTAPEAVFRRVAEQEIEVEYLVNNAGTQVYGEFADNPLEAELAMISLNLAALTALTKWFLGPMLQRHSGRIVNVASTGGFVPAPFNAVYCATKAYVLSFSQGIAEELRGSGVTVTALCPGATDTPFVQKAGMEDVKLFEKGVMDPADVAEYAYHAMLRGKRVAIPGMSNRVFAFSTRFLPRGLVTRAGRSLMGRGNTGSPKPRRLPLSASR